MLTGAYLGIILIWATTPLAIQWSSEGVGFLFGVSARMLIGLLLALGVLGLMRRPLRWDRDALIAYLSGGVGVFGAMFCVYWGAQYIPSGLISVLFGLTPLVTGLLAALLLGERDLTPLRLVGIALGLIGLGVIFEAAAHLEAVAWQGVVAVLGGMSLHSLSTVGVKRYGGDLHPMVMNVGTLLVATSVYLLVWLAQGAVLPETVGLRAGGSILYLGVVATVLGFSLYFYALKHLSAGSIALVPLITPVLALLLGHWLNHEPNDAHIWLGSLTILGGLLLYHHRAIGGLCLPRLRPSPAALGEKAQ